MNICLFVRQVLFVGKHVCYELLPMRLRVLPSCVQTHSLRVERRACRFQEEQLFKSLSAVWYEPDTSVPRDVYLSKCMFWCAMQGALPCLVSSSLIKVVGSRGSFVCVHWCSSFLRSSDEEAQPSLYQHSRLDQSTSSLTWEQMHCHEATTDPREKERHCR